MSEAKVTGVILAGGRGTRMGGADKGLVEHAGRPLIEWVIERLRPQVDELLINANRNLDRYVRYGHRVITDLAPDFPGPLAGLQAGLRHATHPYILTAPCDTPHLPRDLAARLQAAVATLPGHIAVAVTPDGWQPTIALTPLAAAGALDAFLAAGQRRARDWISSQPHMPVLFSSPENFLNLNAPTDPDQTAI